MATRRMKIKAVANVGLRGRQRGCEVTAPPVEPVLSPSPAPLSPRKRSVSPFLTQAESPQSPGKGRRQYIQLDDNESGAPKSPVRRPSPSKSPRPPPPRSPGIVHRPPPSKSPKTFNPKSPMSPRSTADYYPRSCTPPKSPKRPSRPSSGSSFSHFNRSTSPAPRLVSVDSLNNASNYFFDPRSPPSPHNVSSFVTVSQDLPHHPNNGHQYLPHGPIGGNDISQSTSRDNSNCDILRQRLQKPPSAFTTSKYQTARKEFFNKYPHPNIVPDPNELTILQYAFWNPP